MLAQKRLAQPDREEGRDQSRLLGIGLGLGLPWSKGISGKLLFVCRVNAVFEEE